MTVFNSLLAIDFFLERRKIWIKKIHITSYSFVRWFSLSQLFPQCQGYQPRLGSNVVTTATVGREYLDFSHFEENEKMMTFPVLKKAKIMTKNV